MKLSRYIYLSTGLHAALLSGLVLSSSRVSIHFDIRRGLSALEVKVTEEKVARKKTPAIKPKEFALLVAPAGSFVINMPDEKKKQAAAEAKRRNRVLGALHEKATLNSKRFPPAYPDVAAQVGYQATVTLSIEILPTGRTGRVRVLKSSGAVMLDESALRAAKRWIFFKPGEITLRKPMVIEQKIKFFLKAQ